MSTDWTPEEIKEALRQIYDPEVNISIVDLGLIYNIEVKPEGDVYIDLTLTSPVCPFGEVVKEETVRILKQMPGIRNVNLNLVWDPPWDPHSMASEEAKLQLGLL
ncbi:MAG: iron-sulfur cluster assembly protein [candidate division Zixibacteria bacterium]|nr:iron-sulfur cluster assembly protein [candidate division Zixibacteria bacterium]